MPLQSREDDFILQEKRPRVQEECKEKVAKDKLKLHGQLTLD